MPQRTTSPQKQSCHTAAERSVSLLTLPLEIREQILLDVLQPANRLLHPHGRQPWVTDIYRHKTYVAPAILSVCHQLHDESQLIICRRARLVIYPQAETVPHWSRFLIRKFVKYIDFAVPILEQDSRFSTRRKRAMTLLAYPPDKLAAKLRAAFPAVESINLTMCPMLSRSLRVSAYMAGRWNYELQALMRTDIFVMKVRKVKLQLNDKVTDTVLDLLQAYGDEAASSSTLIRGHIREKLHMKLGHLNELKGLKELDIYFTTQLSKTSHNRPIIWAMHTGEGGADPGPNTTSASESMVTRHLRTERARMEGIRETLRQLIPALEGGRLRLCRMLYWRSSVMAEKVDLESVLEDEVKKLLKHRAIVGSQKAGVDTEADLMSLRSRD